MHEEPLSPPVRSPARPSAVRSFGLALLVGLLFLLVVWGVVQFTGNSDLLRFFGRQDLAWQAMQARSSWRVGMDPSFPPFQSLDEDGTVIGFDVDLARRMAEIWGMELEIVALGYDSLLDALQAGRIDSVVSALPYDPRGTRDFAFSPPYFEAGIRLAVRADSPLVQMPITTQDFSAQSLTGLRLAVEWGSMGDMVGRRLQREVESIEVTPSETPGEAIEAALHDASIDGLLIDNVSLREAQGQGAALVGIGPALEGNAYVIAAPLRATVLQERIAATLQELHASGELDRLEEKWFGPGPTVLEVVE